MAGVQTGCSCGCSAAALASSASGGGFKQPYNSWKPAAALGAKLALLQHLLSRQ